MALVSHSFRIDIWLQYIYIYMYIYIYVELSWESCAPSNPEPYLEVSMVRPVG